MIIGKRKRSNEHKINMGDMPLELVNKYTYLGIDLTNNGSFNTCKESLTSKAWKAMNKLKGIISGTKIKKSLALKMFDTLVVPIATYGSVVWAPLDLVS